jgi:cytidylate kinase
VDCKVIAVSRALGAGGEKVADVVAKELGFRYVDNDIIDRAADAAGVSPDTIGQVEHTEPLFMRILTAMGASAISPMGGMPEVMPMPVYASTYREVIEQVIHQVAEEGNAVIVAHGASIPLAGLPGLLRVFITGSVPVRAGRIAASANLNERDSVKAVEESDNQRAQFLRRFYDVRQESPAHYDLVINTDVLTPEDAARLVLAAARG